VTRGGSRRPSSSQIGLAAFFTGAGILHFVRPKPYEAIVPPYVPAKRAMVYVSGAAEIAGGLAVLSPPLRPYARWWLIALLAAVYPANVHMALHPEDVKGLRVPRALLWIRLSFQGLCAWWVARATRSHAK